MSLQLDVSFMMADEAAHAVLSMVLIRLYEAGFGWEK